MQSKCEEPFCRSELQFCTKCWHDNFATLKDFRPTVTGDGMLKNDWFSDYGNNWSKQAYNHIYQPLIFARFLSPPEHKVNSLISAFIQSCMLWWVSGEKIFNATKICFRSSVQNRNRVFFGDRSKAIWNSTRRMEEEIFILLKEEWWQADEATIKADKNLL